MLRLHLLLLSFGWLLLLLDVVEIDTEKVVRGLVLLVLGGLLDLGIGIGCEAVIEEVDVALLVACYVALELLRAQVEVLGTAWQH